MSELLRTCGKQNRQINPTFLLNRSSKCMVSWYLPSNSLFGQCELGLIYPLIVRWLNASTSYFLKRKVLFCLKWVIFYYFSDAAQDFYFFSRWSYEIMSICISFSVANAYYKTVCFQNISFGLFKSKTFAKIVCRT